MHANFSILFKNSVDSVIALVKIRLRVFGIMEAKVQISDKVCFSLFISGVAY